MTKARRCGPLFFSVGANSFAHSRAQMAACANASHADGLGFCGSGFSRDVLIAAIHKSIAAEAAPTKTSWTTLAKLRKALSRA